MSYVGSDVRVDSLAADNLTVAQWFNSFFANPAVFTAGAGDLKYT